LQSIGGADFSKGIEDARIPFYEWVLGSQECYGLVLCSFEAGQADRSELAVRIGFRNDDPQVFAASFIIEWVEIRLAGVEWHRLDCQI